MRHFPTKFSEFPSSETTGPIEKSKRVQKWYGYPLCYAKFGGDPLLHGGVRKKSCEFLLFLFVMLWILNLNKGLAHQRFVIQTAILSPFVGQF